MYGGLYKKDPVNYPLNPKTKLGVGDTRRMSLNFAFIAFMGLISRPWLLWFEGDWGPEYYLEEHGSGFLSDFYGMINAITITAIIFAVIALIL